MYRGLVRGLLILADAYSRNEYNPQLIRRAHLLARRSLKDLQLQLAVFALKKHRESWLTNFHSMDPDGFEENTFEVAMSIARGNLDRHLADHIACSGIKGYCFYSNVVKIAFIAKLLERLNLKTLHDIAVSTIVQMIYDYESLQMCTTKPDFNLSSYRGG